MGISKLFNSHAREWLRVPGARNRQLAELTAIAPVKLPVELIELLRFSNGGEGPLALAPEWFVLDSAQDIIASLSDPFLAENFPGYLFFGGNGGLERIALDIRQAGLSFPIVTIDPISGSTSAEVVSISMSAFIDAIGCPHCQ